MDSGIVTIDLDALARNYDLIRRAAAPAECAAVVKANAYGLGIAAVATHLFDAGCRHFFVATVGEGLELRTILPESTIYVFEGVDAEAARHFIDAQLTPVLNTLDQIRHWVGTGKSAIVHLDTGMTRLGLSASDVDALASQYSVLKHLRIDYWMTHLACAELPGHRLNAQQLERFARMTAKLPPAKHSIGNSAGTLLGPEYRGDLVRPGIALYGGNPFSTEPNPVEAVVTLKAKVLQIREADESLTIGYGATFLVEPGTRLAIVAAGYADGYPRSLSNSGIASVDGAKVPVVGRVSMDLLCLDVTELPRDAIKAGQFVHLIGGGIAIDDVAEAAGTISYELLTGLSSRLQRKYHRST